MRPFTSSDVSAGTAKAPLMRGLDPIARSGDLPVSFAQERLWFLQQLDPGSSAYNMALGVRFVGRLDCEALVRSLNEIIQRHEVLRTSFHSHEGKAIQKVWNHLELNIREIDLQGTDADQREAAAISLAQEEANRPFDLGQAPLLRALLVQLEDQHHILIVVMHHIVSDGWSSAIMMREFINCYIAFSRGKKPVLPGLKIQYADFAVWQRQWLQGETLNRHLEYWKQQLAGVAALELPTDRPRSSSAKHSAVTTSLTLNRKLTRQLKELSRREGVTLFMSLLASWQLVLGKYAGQMDVALGTAIANRNRTEIEGLIGFFVNTLVMRTELKKEMTFQTLLGAVRQMAFAAFQHQDLPFEKLIEGLGTPVEANCNPLFEVMFVMQNTPPRKLEMAGLQVEEIRIETGSPKFELTITVEESAADLTALLTYSSQLWDRKTMERLAAHWQVVLEEMIAKPEQRIGQVSLLRGEERQQILGEWNRTRREYPRDKTITELFEEQVRRSPRAVAMVYGERQVSYEELNRRANQLGHYLKSVGVEAETRVAVCVERSPETVLGFLGVLKSSGAYVPLDSTYPDERLGYILRDTQAPVLLTQGGLKERFKAYTGKIVLLDTDWHSISENSDVNPGTQVTGDNLAYVIYTSGSTGMPKGVAVRHSGLSNLVRWHIERYELTASDRMTQFASVSFDAAAWETWPALAAGASLFIMEEAARTNPSALPDWLQEANITVTFLPTPVAEAALAADWPAQIALRHLLTGGDQLHHVSHLPTFTVTNHYGPTENTVVATAYALGNHSRAYYAPPIGKPITNTQVYVLDEEMELVPAGVAGELYIGADGLARGYLNRPELTAERFVPNPFATADEGERLYRTGDRGRWLEDGNLEFLGRLDQQVKIRGFRIELGEIEAALQEQGEVQQAVVIVREDEPGEKRLIAYVTTTSTGAACGELRDRLALRLPEYMLPSVIVCVEEMPLTPHGKIDRKRLPAPQPRDTAGRRHVRTAAEDILCGIFAQVLKREQVEVQEHFFEAGGHSLLAMQAISRVRKAFGVELPLRALFEAPTAETLAERVAAARGGEWMPDLKSGDELPLSYAQQRMWFLQQMEPESAAYNIAFGMRLKGELNREAVEEAFNAMIKRHRVLRTTFGVEDNRPVQLVARELKLRIEVEDLRTIEETEKREARAGSLAVQEAIRPFALERGPLLRVRLLQMAEQEHVLVVTMHHIVSDGWSSGIMMREFVQVYGAYVCGETKELRPLKIQYSDYAAWERKWLQGEVLDERMNYWRKQLARLEVPELPTDHVRPAVMNYRGASVPFHLILSTEELKELSRREGVTLFMILQAALAAVLSRYTGQSDSVVGTPVANRRREEIEELIGFFVNTLVLRTRVRSRDSLREILAEVKRVTLEAYEHQDIPFEMLVQELQPERDLSRTPLFQVMLALQNTDWKLELPGLQFSEYEIETKVAKFDLLWALREKEGRISGAVNYASDLYEPETVRRLAEHVGWVLQQMVADAGQRIGDLALLRGEEREQVLVTWNQTGADYPQRCVHELFEEQAARTPDGIAVVCGEVEISYGELNRRANRLAHYLKSLGVGPEVQVGICIERDLEMVVGLLGILKAGGAYVALDPRYPQERLKFMLEDSQTALAFTQRSAGELLTSCGVVPIFPEDVREDIDHGSEAAVQSGVHPKNLAYVLYTSGSTGKPKGVAITHQSANQLLHWAREAFSEDLTGVLASTSICFDLSVFELFAPLSWGGTVLLVRDALCLPQWIGSEHVKLVNMVPSAMVELVRMKGVPASVRVVNLAGEALQRTLVEEIYEQGGVERVLNLYGPSEDTTYSTWAWVKQGEKSRNVSIGQPVANTQAYVLDTAGEYSPLPVGMAGELYLGGTGLARGYLNRPELTAERFVPNPFGRTEGERLYRTGDRVRWKSDGQLEFLGRLDHQVKVRGYRIDLGEIESVLHEHPAVTHAAVVVRGSEGGKQLIAFVTYRPGMPEPGEAELREHMRRWLPEYMVPALIMRLEEMPLTANGKSDRNRLPEPVWTMPTSQRSARTAEEEIVCGIFAGVLKRERVGMEENFFQAGGHSLLAMQVMSRIRHVFGLNLPLRSLFEFPTAAALAKQVQGEMRKGKGAADSGIPPAERNKPLPLSFAQQRLWFVHQLEPESVAYNIFSGMRLSGKVHRDALERSIREVVRRHEALRTVFPLREGVPVQEILPDTCVKVREVDLRHLPHEQRTTEIARQVQDEILTPFDLASGPLLRVWLLCVDETEHILLVTMHHIVSDGWSVGIMQREFTQLYQAFAIGEESPLPELEIQYADFAVWQREWLRDEALEQPLEYWRKRLEGVSALELPTDRPRQAHPNSKGGRVPVKISPDLLGQLKELGRGEGVTLLMTLLAGFKALMMRYTGQEDVAIGSVIANRNRIETEALIGFFVNTLVFRTDLTGDPSFAELLKRVRQVALEAYQYQEVPFEKIVEELAPERRRDQLPWIQVRLTLQNAPKSKLDLPDLAITPLEVEHVSTRYELSLLLWEEDQNLQGALEYSADLFDRETMERLLRHYQNILSQMADDRDLTPSTVQLLSEEERAQVLVKWNSSRAEGRPNQPIHTLIEDQARRIPEAIAVVCEGQQLTYRELNRQANQLAHYLGALRVGPEVRVALCLTRSAKMIVGLLAILKSGGAYVPLDAKLPVERKQYMLEDSQAAVIVVDSATAAQMPVSKAQIINLDENAQIQSQPDGDINPTAEPENLAYLIYTSGSTGRPKAVGIEHRQLSNYQWAIWGKAGFEERSSFALVSSVAADLGNTAVFPALCNGATLHIISEEMALNGRKLAEYIEQFNIANIKITPSHLRALMNEDDGKSALPKQRLVLGGEASSWEWIEELQRKQPQLRIFNHYGPTECTVGATTLEFRSNEWKPGAVTLPLGRPLHNLQAYVLDKRMQPAPVGVSGELYIGGAGVGRGYPGAPAMTAEKFVPDPFSQETGSRLYRTGDRSRWLSSGQLEFQGRIDEQVKIRGYRIELGEIEAVLKQAPGVHQAAVILYEGDGSRNDKRLVAYVVGERIEGEGTEGTISGGEVRQYMERMLPDYMLPSAFVWLDQLPLLRNGKLDRKTLPPPQQETAANYAPPETPVQAALCQIWAELLGVDRIGIEENFFHAGGHSLIATKFVSRVLQLFKIELPLRTVFEMPTIRKLALEIEAMKQAASASSTQLSEGPRNGLSPSAAGFLLEDEVEMQQVLAELEALPDEEIQRLLQENKAE